MAGLNGGYWQGFELRKEANHKGKRKHELIGGFEFGNRGWRHGSPAHWCIRRKRPSEGILVCLPPQYIFPNELHCFTGIVQCKN
jgi:hypothetical protein